MEPTNQLENDLYDMARLALTGRRQDIVHFARRLARAYRSKKPELSDRFVTLLQESPSTSNPVRSIQAVGLPLDNDTRMNLVRIEDPIVIDFPVVWDQRVGDALNELQLERNKEAQLISQGLYPSRTALLTGPPGVGKTLAARFLAREFGRPLIFLDLATVMSSYLGRTGNNLRQVLDYAKSVECVLLIDEFDAIAKRRDDPADVGELKRLVNVLLQEIDDWPCTGLLLAATNHPELLDPAIWRRFDKVIEFPLPDENQRRQLFGALVREFVDGDIQTWEKTFSILFDGASHDRIAKVVSEARRRSVLKDTSLDHQFSEIVFERVGARCLKERKLIASNLRKLGVSQRETNKLTGLSRNTIRELEKHTRKEERDHG